MAVPHETQMGPTGEIEPNPEYLQHLEAQQSQSQSRYSPAQWQALNDAVQHELASVSGGAVTVSQMLSGRFGSRAADIADALIQSVDAYGNELSAQEIAEDLAEQAAVQHLPHADGNLEDSFASRQNPRGMELAEEEDAANLIEPDQIGSARLDQLAVSTFQSAYTRAVNQGKPEADHQSFQEISDATEAAWQRQGMGRGDPTPDADPDDADDHRGFVLNSDGIHREQFGPTASDVRSTFESAFDRATKGMMTRSEALDAEAKDGINSHKLDKAHIDYCRRNISGEGTPEW